MKIEKTDTAPSFNSLNIKKVAKEHRHFIDTNINDLKKLGEHYDITLKSVIDSEVRCNGIDITAKDLRKNLGFWQRFNRTKGKSYFYTEKHYDKKAEPLTLPEQIQKAIDNLRKNTKIG